MVSAFIEYQFKLEIQQRYADRRQLASFLGGFYSAVNIVALIVQLFVTQRLLARLGSAGAMALLPMGLALGTGFAVAVRDRRRRVVPAVDQSMGLSVTRVSNGSSTPARAGAEAAREVVHRGGGVERLGEGVAGVVILGIGALFGATTHSLGLAAAVILAAWAVASMAFVAATWSSSAATCGG